MKLHEKSLELNITHELLNLADSWYWFLTDIPLWRYWRPRYRLPFLKNPKSVAGGFHITTEGRNDPSGQAGGGYDVMIKSGVGGHLLFIQYKLGVYSVAIPDPASTFATAPHEHYKFKINSTSTNQHFLLQNLAAGIGATRRNAVVYAFPLIADMSEMEQHSGSLVRRTKFISVADIDLEAVKNGVTITRNQEHNFRIDAVDLDRCELNYFYYYYYGIDRTPEVVADLIRTSFESKLSYYISEIRKNFEEYRLSAEYINAGLQQAFGQYIRYLLHYFETAPESLSRQVKNVLGNYIDKINQVEFAGYENRKHDLKIVNAVLVALAEFQSYFEQPFHTDDSGLVIVDEVPTFQPTFLIPMTADGISFTIDSTFNVEDVENISYLIV